MDKKRFFMVAAAGLIAARPAMATLSELDTKLDTALDSARNELRTEQPLMFEDSQESSAEEFQPQLY